MKKSEFIKMIANDNDFTIKDSTIFYDAFVNALADAIRMGEKVPIQGIGNFHVVTREERVCINPKTQKPVKVPKKRDIRFKKSKKFVDELNNK
ncbi:MAG: HU family DNA-binding protein [Alistipes senegalensis]|nr:HU family DNA-binding protein [Alistipes senegalensis]